MQKLIFIVFLLSLIFSSCKDNVNTAINSNELNATLQSLMDEAIYGSFENTKGVAMSVYAPDLEIDWNGVTGFSDKSKKEPIKSKQQFRIASVTKTFVAAAVLKLHEEDKLNLTDPISKFIAAKHIDLLATDNYNVDKINLIHCLNHTSGLFDYAMDDKSYTNLVLSDPDKVWTRTDQLNFAVEKGDKLSNPGERYHYSDTGYILLGEVIESVTNLPLSESLNLILGIGEDQYPSSFLEPIDSSNTFKQSLIHSYFGRTDISLFNPSMDLYGGGGLVSNTRDLSRFYYDLFNGNVFDNENTLKAMLRKHDTSLDFKSINRKKEKDYRQGFWEVDLYGEKAYMHSGLWSVCCIYIPKYNCSVAVKLTNGSFERLVKKAVLVVKNISEQNS